MSLRRSVIAFVLLAALLSPAIANAQYAEIKHEHDWTVAAFQHRLGLEQFVLTPGDARWTRVHWGFGHFDTSWRAPTIAFVAGGSLAALLVGVVLVFVRGSSSSRRRSADD